METPSTPAFICPHHTKHYIVTLILGIIIGAGMSFIYFNQTYKDAKNSYQSGFETAKKRVLESNMGMIFRTPEDIRAISGKVTMISGNSITIHTESMNPFEEITLNDRIITVTKDTKITKISQGDQKAFQAEMETFMKKMQLGKNTGSLLPPTPPQPVSAIVDISNIVLGDNITITSLENIKTSKNFTASEIQIQ